MLAASAIAGPGPRTLAYRTRILLPLASSLSPSPCIRSLSVTRHVHGKNSKKRRAADKPPSPEVQAAQPLGYIPLLSAPVGLRAYQPALRSLREALSRDDLRSASQAYANLRDWQSTDQLEEKQWSAISNMIASACAKRNSHRDVARILAKDADFYGQFVSMAIDAAARDHWTGLYWLAICLIACGRPQEVLNVCDRLRREMYAVQGRSQEDLHSWHRETRLNARLQGEGLKPLFVVNIAAYTMLEKLDSVALLSLFNTRTHWATMDRIARQDVVRAMSAQKNASKLVDAFDSGLDRFQFALLCYHPNAMLERLNTLTSAMRTQQFNALYHRVLEGTHGEGRFIRPINLNITEPERGDIVIPVRIWTTFIHGFQKFGQAADIARMIDSILPERDVSVNGVVLAAAMKALARIAVDGRLPPESHEVAQQYLTTLIKSYNGHPIMQSDVMVAAMIDIAYVYEAIDTLETMFDESMRKGSLRNVGPKTRSAWIHIWISRFRDDRAIAVLQWTTGPDAIPLHSAPYMAFVRSHLRYNRHNDQVGKRRAVKAIAQALRHKPADLVLTRRTQSAILTLHINDDIQASTKRFLDLLKDDLSSHYRTWQNILQPILTRLHLAYRVTANDACIASDIIARFAQTCHLTEAANRGEMVLIDFFRAVFLSHRIEPAQRREIVLQTLQKYELYFNPPRMSVMLHLFSASLNRKDAMSVADAMYWIEYTLAKYPTVRTNTWWHVRIVQAFCGADLESAAVDVIAKFWNDEAMSPFAKFWTDMDRAGLLAKAGLSGKDIYQAQIAWREAHGGEADPVVERREETNNEEDLDEREERLAEEEETDDEVIDAVSTEDSG